jgi:sorting nexin-5/6/32
MSYDQRFQGFMASFQKTGDELLLSNTLKDVDDFFDSERSHLIEYHGHLRDATGRADRMTCVHKMLADNYIRLASSLVDLGALDAGTPSTAGTTNGDTDDRKTLEKFLNKTADAMEKMRRIEGRVATDQDPKLSDALRYHMHDTNAAKDLLFRRLRCLANYENANKNLDRARAKNRDVPQAENAQQEAVKQFEKISEQAKDELKNLKGRRVVAFQKTLTELAELELKHSKAHAQMLRAAVASLKSEL